MSGTSGWFDEERDAYVYGLMRLLLGVLLCFQGYRSIEASLRSGYFGQFFHLPVLPAGFVPSEPVYFALLGVQVVGGLLAVIGYHGRSGLFLAALAGLYLLACNRLFYHNNRFSVYLVALLSAFTPCERSFLVFRGPRHALGAEERRAPTWARQLVKLQVSAIYLASSTGKLFDPDWRTGVAMLPRFQQALGDTHGFAPSWVRELGVTPWFVELSSKAAIATELFLAFGLWFPRTRAAALWVGFAFHLGIELSASVQLFSWLMGVAYIAFVTPELRERELRFDPGSPSGRWLRRSVPWLDWLARFRLAPASGRGLAVIGRDGVEVRGAAAAASLARALPPLFPLWPLLALVAFLARPRAAPA